MDRDFYFPNGVADDQAMDIPYHSTNITFVPFNDLETPLNKEFICNIPGCGAKFKSSSNQKRHERQHGGEKPFQCNICNRKFARKYDLQVHERIHTKEKPYECTLDSCGKKFTRSSSLREHERNIHNMFVEKTPKPRKVTSRIIEQAILKKKDNSKKYREKGKDDPITLSQETKDQVKQLVNSFQIARRLYNNEDIQNQVPVGYNSFNPLIVDLNLKEETSERVFDDDYLGTIEQ